MGKYRVVGCGPSIAEAWRFVPHDRLAPETPAFIKAALEAETIRLLSDGWYLKSSDLLGFAGLLGGPVTRQSLHKLEEGDYLVELPSGGIAITEAEDFSKWYTPALPETFKQDIAATINNSGA